MRICFDIDVKTGEGENVFVARRNNRLSRGPAGTSYEQMQANVARLTGTQPSAPLTGKGVSEYDAIRDLCEKLERQAWKSLYGDDE
jgi:hypothetical protein